MGQFVQGVMKRAGLVALVVLVVGLTACDSANVLDVQARVPGATLTTLVRDLRNLDQRANLTRERYWRLNGKVPSWDNRPLADDDRADVTDPFHGAITSFGTPGAPNDVWIDVTLQEHAGVGEIDIMSGGIGVGDDRMPSAAMERVYAVLKAMYGDRNVRMCTGFC